MSHITYILARSSDDEFMKIVFGVGAVIVWGLFQLIGGIAKKAEEAKRRQRYGRLPADVARRGGAPPLPIPPMPGQRKQNKAKGTRKVAAAPPPKRAALVAPGATAFAAGGGGQAAQQPVAVAKRPRAAGAPAGQIAGLLRRPESLRAGVILNEVLGRPVGLREGTRG